MKIAIMAAWNTNSGVAMHAEPIGKAFIEMGHEVTFLPILQMIIMEKELQQMMKIL